MGAHPPRRRPAALRPLSVAGWGAAFVGALAIGGCAIFDESVEALTPGGYDETATSDPRMTSFRPVIDQITLEVLLIERPGHDALSDRALWDAVSEVGEIDADQAERLRAAGFRVGVAAADPPEAVRRLLEKEEAIGAPLPGTAFAGARDRGVIVKRVPLRAGQDAALQTGPSGRRLRVVDGDANDGAGRTESFSDAVGAVRVVCRTPQKGWVTFEVTPEIHHGPASLRPVPGAAGLESAAGQRVRAWPDRSFEVTLTRKDSIILGLWEDAPADGLAAALLAGERDGHAADRLLVIRLADVRQIEGRSSR